MLQNGLLPKAQQEGKLFACLKALSQRPTQSVGDFLAHFTTIKQQLDYKMLDWMTPYFIITGVHPYLQETLRLRDRLGKTRLELKDNLRSIEGMAPALIRISVRETYRVSQGELTPVKTKDLQTKKKFVPGRTTNSKRKKRPVEVTTPSQTVAVSTPAPARKEGSGSPTKCFWCGKLGYFAWNCKFKDAVAAMVLDNSEKVGISLCSGVSTSPSTLISSNIAHLHSGLYPLWHRHAQSASHD